MKSTDGRRAVALALALLFATPSLGEGESLGDVYHRVSTSVVVIRARGQEVTADGTLRFTETGSGVLISPDGKVATAAHVVQTMENITVEFLGEEPVPARVIASEQWADISILPPGLGGAPRGHGGEARRLRPRPRRRSGLHRWRALRSQLFAERGDHQRAVGR